MILILSQRKLTVSLRFRPRAGTRSTDFLPLFIIILQTRPTQSVAPYLAGTS